MHHLSARNVHRCISFSRRGVEQLESRLCLDSTVVFNELMYNPGPNQDLEWIELHSQMAVDVDLSNWRLDGVDFRFPTGTVLSGGQYLVIAKSPSDFARQHGAISVLGPYGGRLDNGGETIRLINNNGRVMDEIDYDDRWPWPAGADGSGASLAKTNEDHSSADAEHWAVSQHVEGTPGSRNHAPTDANSTEIVVIGLNSPWHYDDQGANHGTRWLSRDFNPRDPNADGLIDDAWHVGLPEFATPLNIAADATGTTLAPGAVTHYFRTEFNVDAPETTQLKLHLEVDDGAVIYLNGHEVSRLNMPSGRVAHTTLALEDRELPLVVDSLPISSEHLEVGVNTLSVEVHQAVAPATEAGAVTDDSPVTSQGLALVQEGPAVESNTSLAPVNLATGATAFALDELGLGIHVVSNVNDRKYGNDSSWVANLARGMEGPFIGLNLGTNPVHDIQSIAFGRSNVAQGDSCRGGVCANRTSGRYTIQYTQVPSPDETLSTTEDESTGWVTIGTLDYDAPPAALFQNPHQRHRYNFEPVSATGFRIVVPEVGIAFGTGIDEIELYDEPFRSESLDVWFSAQLTAFETQPLPAQVVFTEVAGGDDAEFFVEMTNQNSVPIELMGFELVNRRLPLETVQLPAIRLLPDERFVIDGADMASDVRVGDLLFLYGPGRKTLADAVSVEVQSRGRSHEYGRRWLHPNEATPGDENIFSLQDAIVINEVAYNAGVIPAAPAKRAEFLDEIVVPFESTWRHSKSFTLFADDLPVDPGPNWAASAHEVDEINWLSGQAPLGAANGRLPLRISRRFGNPAQSSQFITAYYFELEFALTQEQLRRTDELQLRHMVDDGAVFYLNGHEVARFQMPDGTPNASTLASHEVVNAVIRGPVSLGTSQLVALPRTNRLSVEVHQSSTTSDDIVFAAELTRRELLNPGSPAVAPVELEEGWIELFNRSEDLLVDLSHWQIRDGIQFTFPPGTTLAPRQYLVVARDKHGFQAKYPEVRHVLGDYAGMLSNRGERIEIVDARGNPVDEMHYYDRGRWPELADGGRSTLELRDPTADNSIPEAWGPSDESNRSEWQTYRYRGTVQPDGFNNGVSTRYHELIVGLLDTGRVLIDDISVVEDPDGAANERIQNGSFEQDHANAEPSKWRIGGNHSGTVVSDPTDLDNHALYLSATGPLEDRLNHAETTFSDQTRIREGVEYEISFRAKWMGGSNQLNTHLYFNRLPRTTLLQRPDRFGTPGQANSVLIGNLGPTFQRLTHWPVIPEVKQPVRVTVEISDAAGIADTWLWYAVDNGPFRKVRLQPSNGDEYHADIPGQESRATVQFYVEATDSRGASSTFPADGEGSRALYRVQDGRARGGAAHDFRIIMTPDDTARLHERTNQMSNRLMRATVVYNESEVFYNVGVRLKGSNAGRGNDAFLGFHVRFDPIQPFRGVHQSVAIDRSGRSGPVPQAQDEILIKHIVNHAGGVPGMYDDLVRVIAPNRRHDRSALLMMARYGNDFLDSQFENGSDGTVFKLDIAYVPNQTTDRDPESLKVPFPYSHPQPTKDLEDLGEDRELYRSHLVIRNNRAADDYNRIIEAARVLDLRGDEQIGQVQQVIDIDQWARTFAIQSLTGAADAYTQGGLHHNIVFYVRPADQRVLALPWDWDFAFTQPASAPLVGTGGNGGRLFRIDQFRRLYLGHMLDVINTTFNNDYLDRWIDHYGSIARQNLAPIKAYVSARRNHVLRRLPDPIPFQIHDGEGALTVDRSKTTVTGQGWIDVRTVRLAGREEPLDVRWLDDRTWQTDVVLAADANMLSIEAFDHQGQLVGTDSVSVPTPPFVAQAGDANQDRQFDPQDIVQVLQARKYQQATAATFGQGDWNGDGLFDQQDIVAALATGNYLQGPYAALAEEPPRVAKSSELVDMAIRFEQEPEPSSQLQ